MELKFVCVELRLVHFLTNPGYSENIYLTSIYEEIHRKYEILIKRRQNEINANGNKFRRFRNSQKTDIKPIFDLSTYSKGVKNGNSQIINLQTLKIWNDILQTNKSLSGEESGTYIKYKITTLLKYPLNGTLKKKVQISLQNWIQITLNSEKKSIEKEEFLLRLY